MKNLLKAFAILFLVTTVFTACSKDDDPADNDLFVGTYNGSITYTSGDVNKSNDNGSVRVVKVGNNYNFAFSDDIPNLNGVEFRKDENSVISVGSDESKFIRITESELRITFTKDGQFWTATCTR
jgi:hypothetical protein